MVKMTPEDRADLDKKKEMKVVDVTFDILLIGKSIFAFFETLAGFALFFVTPAVLNSWIEHLTAGRFHQHFITHALQQFGHSYTADLQLFAAIYLIVHGGVKLFTLVLLWRRVLWAYPLSLIVFALFTVWQGYEWIAKHSLGMFFIVLLDILMIVLTWIEWQSLKDKLGKNKKQKVKSPVV